MFATPWGEPNPVSKREQARRDRIGSKELVVLGVLATEGEELIESRFISSPRPDPIERALSALWLRDEERRRRFAALVRSETTGGMR